MPLLNEVEKRRSDFKPGVPVTLSDGQRWELPRPGVGFVPDDGPQGFRSRLVLHPDRGYGDLADAIDAAHAELAANPDAGPSLVRAELRIAAACLRRNYDLTIDEVGALIRFGYAPDDVEGRRLRDEVLSVALGNSPAPVASNS